MMKKLDWVLMSLARLISKYDNLAKIALQIIINSSPSLLNFTMEIWEHTRKYLPLAFLGSMWLFCMCSFMSSSFLKPLLHTLQVNLSSFLWTFLWWTLAEGMLENISVQSKHLNWPSSFGAAICHSSLSNEVSRPILGNMWSDRMCTFMTFSFLNSLLHNLQMNIICTFLWWHIAL